MKINGELFDYAARLAKLKFSQEESARETENLAEIAAFIGELKSIDNNLSCCDNDVDNALNLRADVPCDSFDREVVMANSADNDGALFIVPQTI